MLSIIHYRKTIPLELSKIPQGGRVKTWLDAVVTVRDMPEVEPVLILDDMSTVFEDFWKKAWSLRQLTHEPNLYQVTVVLIAVGRVTCRHPKTC